MSRRVCCCRRSRSPMNRIDYPSAVVCIDNEGNEVSLQLWKIYKPLRDDDARSGASCGSSMNPARTICFRGEFRSDRASAEVRKPLERVVREQRRASTLPRISDSDRRLTAKKSKHTPIWSLKMSPRRLRTRHGVPSSKPAALDPHSRRFRFPTSRHSVCWRRIVPSDANTVLP